MEVNTNTFIDEQENSYTIRKTSSHLQILSEFLITKVESRNNNLYY